MPAADAHHVKCAESAAAAHTAPKQQNSARFFLSSALTLPPLLPPMHRICSPSFMAFSGAARWRASALALRVFPRPAALGPPVRRVSRFTRGWRDVASSTRVKSNELVKPDRSLIHSATHVLISLGTMKVIARSYGDVHGERRASVNAISGYKDACRTSLEVIDSKRDTAGGVTGCELSNDVNASVTPCLPIDYVGSMDILPDSSHRDGSIYIGCSGWKRVYRLANRNETRLEAMKFSNPTNCCMHNRFCMSHIPRDMKQIFSLKLSKIHVDGASVGLYGYIAVRDNIDPLLNYIVNFSRDHPIIIEQGSLLNMTGPKRGIELVDTIIIEYDMKIKMGEQEKDDLQLIDGVSVVDDIDTFHCRPFTCRIHGDCGAIDITAACLSYSVEATVEVLISEVRGSFNMHLDCFSSGIHEEIQLFDGSIGESCGLKRSVVAVVLGAQMDLKFKVGTDSSVPAEHCCSFKSTQHGRDTQEIKTDLGLISVNVVWSILSGLGLPKLTKNRL